MSDHLPPKGPWCSAYVLELTLADSQTFRDLVGAATREEAQESIYFPWMLNPEVETNEPQLGRIPRAIIIADSDIAATSRMQIAVGSFRGESMGLGIDFHIPIPDEEYAKGIKNAGYWFLNQVGSIMCDLETMSGGKGESAGGLSLFDCRSWSLSDGPTEMTPDEYTMEWMRDEDIPHHVWAVMVIVNYV